MIYHSLERFSDYVCLHPLFKSAESFLKKLLTSENLRTGRHEWDLNNSDELYANVQCYQTKPFSKGAFETHKRYIDLQYIISGEEMMYLPAATISHLVEQTPYQEKADYSLQDLLRQEDCTKLTMHAGCFAILFPGEPHAPCLETANGSTEVQKIIVKIRYE